MKDNTSLRENSWKDRKYETHCDEGDWCQVVSINVYAYFQSCPETCRNGFAKAGIADAISNPNNIAPASHDNYNDDDPFSDMDDNDKEDHVFNSD